MPYAVCCGSHCAGGPPPLEPDEAAPTQNASTPKIRYEGAHAIEANNGRHEWFQTPTTVTVEVFVKGRKQDDVSVDITPRKLDISVRLDSGSEYQLSLELADAVVPEQSKYSVLGSKVEVRLQKARAAHWASLEGASVPVTAWGTVNDGERGLAYPSSSRQGAKGGRDWDAVARESGADEEEKLEGDAALNKVFAGIYKNASDEQRMAMLKSFQESGGTVLSTNWDEVGKAPVKGTPPDGLEMRRWEDLNH